MTSSPWYLLALCLLAACVGHAKAGRTLFIPDEVARAQEKCEQLDWARQIRDGAVDNARWLVEMSDQELSDYVPPAEQRRALNVNFGGGCPVHGPAVFREGGHYPWIVSRELPFKVKCPVGGEIYPSNDFEPWNPGDLPPEHGAEIIDHGTGWASPEGQRYWFVGYYLFWGRWQREILPGIGHLARAYRLTDDPRYAHAALVLLARIAQDYPDYVYGTQAYHSGKYPNPWTGRILDRIWMTGVARNFAEAYDSIYPAVSTDHAAATFLAGKGIDQPNQWLEQRLLGGLASDIMSGLIKGNNGMHQSALAALAIALDNDDMNYAPTKQQMLDWLLTGGGEVEELLWNGFYRDGHGGESSPGYSAGWNFGFYSVAELLPKLGVDIWANPKLKKMADIGLDLTVAGEFTPSIGDSGSILGSRRVGWSSRLQGEAFRHYPDPRYAAALEQLGSRAETLEDEPIDDALAAALKEPGATVTEGTRSLGGYGLAVLEGGQGEHRRGVSMYYGHAGGGHGHRDRLTMELFAFGRPLLTDMGYPAHWLAKNTYWTSNTLSHFCVMVDDRPHQTMFRGTLEGLGSTADVQFAEAEAADVTYPGQVSRYRRSLALVDLDETHCYLVDLFRVTGGQKHHYSFHGPPFPQLETAGLVFGPAQAQGTLAGSNVTFGQGIDERDVASGKLYELDGFAGVVKDQRPYAARSTEGWAAYTDTRVLTRQVGAKITQRAPAPAGKLYAHLRVHDYTTGECTVELGLGESRGEVTWGGGPTGMTWLPPVELDSSGGEAELTVTATAIGQNYALLDALVLSPSPDEPAIIDKRSSGYQYLRQPRRALPDGAWSATWSLPDEDLHLALHVPGGTAQAVVSVDAEPELKPHMPDKLDYLLLENVGHEGEPLSSTYVAVVEPYQGAPQVRQVERLQVTDGPPEAVALRIKGSWGEDLLYSSLTPDQPATVRWSEAVTLRVQGRLVRATMADGQPVNASLFDDGKLTVGDVTIEGPQSLTGTVQAVDYQTNTLQLDQPVPPGLDPTGRAILFHHEQHGTDYAIASADGNRLSLGDTLMIVGVGQVAGFGPDQLKTDTVLTGYGRVDGGQHQGRRLLNERYQSGPRITRVVKGEVDAEPGATKLPEFFTDADGDGQTRFWIGDVGVGDTYRIPSVQRWTTR